MVLLKQHLSELKAPVNQGSQTFCKEKGQTILRTDAGVFNAQEYWNENDEVLGGGSGIME